jgi:phage-related protein (TIGR01555 family)
MTGVVQYLFDGLQNFVSGVGTQKDKSANWTHVYEPLTRDQVDAIYSSDWLARKIVDIVAYDMTREWRTWQSDDAEAMYAAEKALRVRTVTRKALTYARLYGGSAIMIGDGSRDPAKPLVLDRMGVNGIKYLHVFTRDDLEEVDGSIVDDINSPDLGKTMLYRVRDRRGGRSDVIIHRSRLAFFCGPEAPADQPTAHGWGHSVYDSGLKAIVNVNATAANAAAMSEEAKIDVITVPDLHKLLATQEGTNMMLRRWSLANTLKSTVNTLLIGKDEQFNRKEMNFGGLPDLIRTHIDMVSGAADVPIVRLFGQSPGGLNSTGESDTRNYYDMLRSRQTTELEESLWPLDEALKRHVTGAAPEELVYEWVPLWQLSESERADIAQKKMSALTQLSGLNLFAPEELRPAIFDMLMQDGFLATLDAHLLEEADFEALLVEKQEAEVEKAAAMAEATAKPQLRVVGQDGGPPEGSVPFEDHTPGGHEHDQKTHGRGGSGARPSEAISPSQKSGKLSGKEVLTRAHEVATKLGYPTEMVKIGAEDDPDRYFTLNGTIHMAAALAHTRPGGSNDTPIGTIKLYASGLTEKSLDGTVAHEVMHQKWQKVWDQYEKQRDDFFEEPDLPDDIEEAKDKDGFLKSPYKEKYPIFSELSVIMYGGETYGENWDRMKKEDGVTAYSKEWWTKWESTESKGALDSAVHETLAEIARLDFESEAAGNGSVVDRMLKLKDGPWGALYKAVQKHYEALK